MSWPQTGATQYHAQLGLPDKGPLRYESYESGTQTLHYCRVAVLLERKYIYYRIKFVIIFVALSKCLTN